MYFGAENFVPENVVENFKMIEKLRMSKMYCGFWIKTFELWGKNQKVWFWPQIVKRKTKWFDQVAAPE